MTLASFRGKVDLNPELEALRAKGLKESAQETNEWILRLIARTSRIHAGFLFEDLKTLQNLCLFISETPNKITDAGWEAFGYHLGLSPSVLKVINYNNFNKEDPCYNVLLAYVQNENASIGKILKTLKELGRIDVLSRIQHSINELADIIYQYNVNNDRGNSLDETSDYESLTSDGNSSSNINDASYELIKPKVIPPAPLIFQNIQASPDITSQQIRNALNIVIHSFSKSDNENCKTQQNLNAKISCINNFLENHRINLVTENFQQQSIINYEKKNFTASNRQKYGIKILLTFAEDGEKYVEEISKVFRRKRDNYPKIGVLVLAEHAGTVNKDPLQFISGAFSQVDYVCPILTSQYFNLISKKQTISSVSNMHIDVLYASYIFQLMNSYFISNNCLNDKVRCIIPDEQFSLIPVGNLWANPVLGAWVRLSEIDDLAMRLLKNKKKVCNVGFKFSGCF